MQSNAKGCGTTDVDGAAPILDKANNTGSQMGYPSGPALARDKGLQTSTSLSAVGSDAPINQ